jgi:translation initiation factor 4B
LNLAKDRDRPDARDFGDWTRKGPLPDLPSNNRRVSDRGFGSRNFESDRLSDAGSDRADRRRSPFAEGDGRVRDFGNWERKGPLSPLPPTAPAARNGRPTHVEAGADRKRSPAWGEGRSQDGSRPPRREFTEKPHIERTPTAPELDNEWRSKMRPNPPASKESTPSREPSGPPSPAAPPAPTVRPKLNLQKRTISEAEVPSPTPAVSDAKANPFGGARPIDTAAKEREIEEKRQLALRLKREQDEKAKEEKRLAKDAAKAEKPVTTVSLGTKEKENGGETPPSGKNFEILRKAGDEGDVSDATEEDNEADQGKAPAVVEKPMKPREMKNVPPKKSEGAWRRKSDNKKLETPAEQGTQSIEEGWSTVSKPKNSRRGGHQNQAARAIAS